MLLPYRTVSLDISGSIDSFWTVLCQGVWYKLYWNEYDDRSWQCWWWHLHLWILLVWKSWPSDPDYSMKKKFIWLLVSMSNWKFNFLIWNQLSLSDVAMATNKIANSRLCIRSPQKTKQAVSEFMTALTPKKKRFNKNWCARMS